MQAGVSEKQKANGCEIRFFAVHVYAYLCCHGELLQVNDLSYRVVHHDGWIELFRCVETLYCSIILYTFLPVLVYPSIWIRES